MMIEYFLWLFAGHERACKFCGRHDRRVRASGRRRLRARQPTERLAVIFCEDALSLVPTEHLHSQQPAQPLRLSHGAVHALVCVRVVLVDIAVCSKWSPQQL